MLLNWKVSESVLNMEENKLRKFQLLFETETITPPFAFSNPEVNIWHFCHVCINVKRGSVFTSFVRKVLRLSL
jgi:hypothetical protein